ncbi:CDP-glycerol--glycerophosphate glycerophosphotransferase [Alteromonas sp. KUL156]|nr:CDP-glycerol--glycerophosphate glycerophosphotransferase [Alteromonas sp. KUL154]GFD97611.1 CDP-glycerol--glycerophosphate glycerophosphotransferase [Alteromonas sp. KUL156]
MRFLLYISQNYSFEILRPLQQEMRSAGHEVKWFVEGNDVNTSLFHEDEEVFPSIKEVIHFNPDASFVPGNLIPSFLPGLKVQLFHGFEWKKKGHFRIRGCFDLYCTQGPFFTRKFEELRLQHPHFTVKETGWTKLDNVFKSGNPDTPTNKQRVILYAPTFSPSLTSTEALFEHIVALSKKHDWQWKVKFHPKMDKATIEKYMLAQHDKLEVVTSSSILPLLRESDVMISDTSSAITEFLLMGKPVVTYKNAQPEPVLINIDNADVLEMSIIRALAMDSELENAIKVYSSEMHPYKDGESAKRVLAATIDEIEHFPRSENCTKPKNWFRNFKLRKRLRYWR